WRRDLLASILPRLVGREIMPVAYLLANIELAAYQAALDLPTDERANWAITAAQLSSAASTRVSLSNVLVDTYPLALPPACLPIILGNPPYAGHSLNHSYWLSHLLESYK